MGDLMTSRIARMHPDAPFISLPLSYMFVKYLHKNKAGMMRKILTSHDVQHSTLLLSEKISNQNHSTVHKVQQSCNIPNLLSQFTICSDLQRDRTIHTKVMLAINFIDRHFSTSISYNSPKKCLPTNFIDRRFSMFISSFSQKKCLSTNIIDRCFSTFGLPVDKHFLSIIEPSI